MEDERLLVEQEAFGAVFSTAYLIGGFQTELLMGRSQLQNKRVEAPSAKGAAPDEIAVLRAWIDGRLDNLAVGTL